MHTSCFGLRTGLGGGPFRAPSSPSSLLHQRQRLRGGFAPRAFGVRSTLGSPQIAVKASLIQVAKTRTGVRLSASVQASFSSDSNLDSPQQRPSTRLAAALPDSHSEQEPKKKSKRQGINRRKRDRLRELLLAEGVSEADVTSILGGPQRLNNLELEYIVEGNVAAVLRTLKEGLGVPVVVELLTTTRGLNVLQAEPQGVQRWIEFLKGDNRCKLVSIVSKATRAVLSEGPEAQTNFLRGLGVTDVVSALNAYGTARGNDGALTETLAHLRDALGIENISRILELCPEISTLSLEENVKPRVVYFESLGLAKIDIGKMIRANPRNMLGNDILETIAPLVAIYRQLHEAAGRGSDLTAFLLKNPSALGLKPLAVLTNLEFFEQELGLTIFQTPEICSSAPRTIFKKIMIWRQSPVLQERWSVRTAITKTPQKLLEAAGLGQGAWQDLEEVFDSEHEARFAALKDSSGKSLPAPAWAAERGRADLVAAWGEDGLREYEARKRRKGNAELDDKSEDLDAA